MPRGRSAEEMRQVTRERVAKQRQRAAAIRVPTPVRPSSADTTAQAEGPDLVRPQTETVAKRPMVDKPVDSGVEDAEVEPSEDLSRYAPRTVQVGIYGPIGPSRPVIVYACCDIAARQLRWVNNTGEILIEPPAAKGDVSMRPTPSDRSASASPYSGLGSYRHSAPFYRSRFERLMNEGA